MGVIPGLAQGTKYSAELIHFTVDNTENGTSLLPGFRHHSCWSGIGRSNAGNIYIAVSNHYQPRRSTDEKGNDAVYKYDPVQDKMTLLGDLKSVSTAVNNWMPDESQHKVHTFLMEHADGRMYFATDDYSPSFFLRGAHMYYIDLKTDKIVDYSKTQPYLMRRDMTVMANTRQAQERSGVFVEYYGIKGISLNPRVPDLVYAMTYPDGHIIKHKLSDGSLAKVAASPEVDYVMYTDNYGNLFYTIRSGGNCSLWKYTLSSGNNTQIRSDFGSTGFGMISPTAGGDTVYCVTTGQEIWRLVCSKGEFEYVVKFCGTVWGSPGLFNMTISPDGTKLYFISIDNNDFPWERLVMVDLTEPNRSQMCHDREDSTIFSIVENRGLCFGGINVWDKSGHFYAPVWNGEYRPPRLALLKVGTPENSGIHDAGIATRLVPYSGLQVVPNPVKTRARVELVTLTRRHHDVGLYNMQGLRKKTFFRSQLDPGKHALVWETTGDDGQRLLPGVYLVTVNGKVEYKVYLTE
jgi:hypothetical protein